WLSAPVGVLVGATGVVSLVITVPALVLSRTPSPVPASRTVQWRRVLNAALPLTASAGLMSLLASIPIWFLAAYSERREVGRARARPLTHAAAGPGRAHGPVPSRPERRPALDSIDRTHESPGVHPDLVPGGLLGAERGRTVRRCRLPDRRCKPDGSKRADDPDHHLSQPARDDRAAFPDAGDERPHRASRARGSARRGDHRPRGRSLPAPGVRRGVRRELARALRLRDGGAAVHAGLRQCRDDARFELVPGPAGRDRRLAGGSGDPAARHGGPRH